MAEKWIKNPTGSSRNYAGQTVAAGAYYQLSEADIVEWATSSSVLADIGAATGIMARSDTVADEITDVNDAIAFLKGETEPPRTKDGDWTVVNENFAHVTGNHGINWFIEKELEDGETYSETLVLPAGRHATINLMRGGSDRVPSTLKLEWFEEISTDVYMRINPWIRVHEIVAGKLNGAHTAGDTVLTLHNTNDEVSFIRGKYYCFYDSVGDVGFFHKVASKDPDNDQITLEAGLPQDMPDGSILSLTDRPIGRIGNQIASDALNFISPPNGFIGNGKNYFKLTLKNEDTLKVGIITATVNGWHTDDNGGD